MNQIAKRVNQVRELMKQQNLSAYLIPGTDPFLSEYLPDCWNQRKYISGFTGSAGKIIITPKKAGLWTDSRYFLQASEELEGSGFTLLKSGLPQTPTMEVWLKKEVPENGTVGVNPQLLSINDYESLTLNLAKNDINLTSAADLIEEFWIDQPSIPMNKVSVLSDDIAGESVGSKINKLRENLKMHGADACFISSLDEIAWLFNMRGADIQYNPVCISYALITITHAFLYIHPIKITQEFSQKEEITCIPYNEMNDHIQSCAEISTIIIDPARLNFASYQLLNVHFNVTRTPSWITLQKAIKNSFEINGTRNAMIKDGVALVRFFIWLERALNEGKIISEYDLGIQLKYFRSCQEGFKDESFSTIAGYDENGAIVHYSAKKENCKTLLPKGILLIDSGAQYEHGTTDITRTIALGSTSNKVKKDYTVVLKGHLALSSTPFPKGTRGDQLDALARQYLWKTTLDYGHGTGHGVGHYLNVHEGPQSIRKDFNPTPLLPGMICSNEPGLYRSGEYGIRIENLVLVKAKETNEFGDFLAFETLTLFPYDQTLIDIHLLSKSEIQQINDYHQKVRESLIGFLSKEEKKWLEGKTQSLHC